MTTIDKARELEEEQLNQLAEPNQKECLLEEDFLFNNEIEQEAVIVSGPNKLEFVFGEEHAAEVRKKNEELNELQCISPEEYKSVEEIIEEAFEAVAQDPFGGGSIIKNMEAHVSTPEELKRVFAKAEELKKREEEYFEKELYKTSNISFSDYLKQGEKLNNTHDESGKKNTNPKDAIGISKVPMSTLSGPVMMEAGLAMMEGALKYGRHNFREAGVRASVYFDALKRHAWGWWEGEDIDVESGLNHITKAISTLMVLRDSMIRENWIDDRPPKVKDGWIQEYNKKAKELLEKYPNPVQAYTQLNNKK